MAAAADGTVAARAGSSAGAVCAGSGAGAMYTGVGTGTVARGLEFKTSCMRMILAVGLASSKDAGACAGAIGAEAGTGTAAGGLEFNASCMRMISAVELASSAANFAVVATSKESNFVTSVESNTSIVGDADAWIVGLGGDGGGDDEVESSLAVSGASGGSVFDGGDLLMAFLRAMINAFS